MPLAQADCAYQPAGARSIPVWKTYMAIRNRGYTNKVRVGALMSLRREALFV